VLRNADIEIEDISSDLNCCGMEQPACSSITSFSSDPELSELTRMVLEEIVIADPLTFHVKFLDGEVRTICLNV
jgi:hypothetical protein